LFDHVDRTERNRPAHRFGGRQPKPARGIGVARPTLPGGHRTDVTNDPTIIYNIFAHEYRRAVGPDMRDLIEAGAPGHLRVRVDGV
jgi:hypothetical protein